MQGGKRFCGTGGTDLQPQITPEQTCQPDVSSNTYLPLAASPSIPQHLTKAQQVLAPQHKAVLLGTEGSSGDGGHPAEQ